MLDESREHLALLWYKGFVDLTAFWGSKGVDCDEWRGDGGIYETTILQLPMTMESKSRFDIVFH